MELFLAVLLTIKTIAVPLQLMNVRMQRRRQGVQMGEFKVFDIFVQAALVLVWAIAMACAWVLFADSR